MAKRKDPEQYEGKINVPGSPIQLPGWRKPYITEQPPSDAKAERAIPFASNGDAPPLGMRGRR